MIPKIAFTALLILSSCIISDKKEQKSEIQILSEKISHNPADIDLLYSRVNYNKSINELESALFDLKEIIILDSLNAFHHNNIAAVYFELLKGNNPKPTLPALVQYHLEKSLRLNSKSKDALSLMGELLLAYNKNEDAIKSLNASLELDYNQEKTHMLMGYAFKQLKQNENAINCFRNAININPDFFEAHMQLGQIFHLLSDTTALIYYNNALKLKPADEMALYNKALFYQNLLQWNNALDAYAALHKVSPFNSDAHYNLGFIHMELGLYDIATNNFSDAIYSNSEFYEAYYSRGNCFETLGNIAQAESDYKRAISINQEYEYAIQALEILQKKIIINIISNEYTRKN
jgi:tetratricopeptide (TPR) repeat protein